MYWLTPARDGNQTSHSNCKVTSHIFSRKCNQKTSSSVNCDSKPTGLLSNFFDTVHKVRFLLSREGSHSHARGKVGDYLSERAWSTSAWRLIHVSNTANQRESMTEGRVQMDRYMRFVPWVRYCCVRLWNLNSLWRVETVEWTKAVAITTER